MPEQAELSKLVSCCSPMMQAWEHGLLWMKSFAVHPGIEDPYAFVQSAEKPLIF